MCAYIPPRQSFHSVHQGLDLSSVLLSHSIWLKRFCQELHGLCSSGCQTACTAHLLGSQYACPSVCLLASRRLAACIAHLSVILVSPHLAGTYVPEISLSPCRCTGPGRTTHAWQLCRTRSVSSLQHL